VRFGTDFLAARLAEGFAVGRFGVGDLRLLFFFVGAMRILR
jgi:hypothetical protein